VDLDFPLVLRAFAPLDAIAQAAGRCNRNGLLSEVDVSVFFTKDEAGLYPDGAYRQAAGVTGLLLKNHGPQAMDIHSPELFIEYYKCLYDFARPDTMHGALRQAIAEQDFVTTAREYRLIPKDAMNVLVPYDRYAYERLSDEARQAGLSRHWIREARSHAISIFRPTKPDAPVLDWIEPVPIGRDRHSNEWYIYLNEKHYDPEKGLVITPSAECLIA
jgi:CRISPR/Cas system-associated endonuclease/helicase Cas3